MNKNKKIIIITCSIFGLLFILFLSFSIFMSIKNNKLKENDLYIVIEQKDESGKEKIIYKELFTNELSLELDVYSKIRENGYNKVIINNGKCYLINTNCPTHSCESYVINRSSGIFDTNTTISCLPNGLFIHLEQATE